MLDQTHDPQLRSWITSANDPATDYPIQNLPFAVFRRAGSREAFRGGVAIGDQILDLAAARKAGAFSRALVGPAASRAASAASKPTLNDFMGAGRAASVALRRALSLGLRSDSESQSLLAPCLVAQNAAAYAVPARIGDYTDFYTSIHHALAVGRLFRPDHPLLPNYKWVPIGYHGRSSSIAISGLEFARPSGQIVAPAASGASTPVLGPSARLDYELEVGVYVGQGNELGSPIPIAHAEDAVFGLCLLNDWSARDIQAWEYQPLGPFLGKNFATTVSPWIVTLEALEPYRVPWTRPTEDPQPLAYLDSADVRSRGAIDLNLEVWLQTQAMRRHGVAPYRLSHSNFRHAYWSIAQLVAHHSVNGCNLQSGDLLGSGTQSDSVPSGAGSMLELSRNGAQPLRLPNGETRSFLQDGDTVIMRGWCERAGAVRIGLGEVSGQVGGSR
ncbi:MAG TPA: fumarylacetoacetase [Steroidobacteraceae bacterium]|jgi:fumarylacetoacetase